MVHLIAVSQYRVSCTSGDDLMAQLCWWYVSLGVAPSGHLQTCMTQYRQRPCSSYKIAGIDQYGRVRISREKKTLIHIGIEKLIIKVKYTIENTNNVKCVDFYHIFSNISEHFNQCIVNTFCNKSNVENLSNGIQTTLENELHKACIWHLCLECTVGRSKPFKHSMVSPSVPMHRTHGDHWHMTYRHNETEQLDTELLILIFPMRDWCIHAMQYAPNYKGLPMTIYNGILITTWITIT